MKTFKQFINENAEIDVESLHREVAGYIGKYNQQARGVYVSCTSALDKCIEILEDAPFDKITQAAFKWYNNQADHNIRVMDKIRDELAANAKKIKGFKTPIKNFNVPMKYALTYYLSNLANPKGIDYRKIDMFDSINNNGISNLLERIKGEAPSIDARKGAVFLTDPPGRQGNPRKSKNEWIEALTKAKITAGYCAAVFKHQKKSMGYLDPSPIITKLENSFNAKKYSEASEHAKDLMMCSGTVENCKSVIDLLASRYFDIFSEITTIGK